MERANRGRKAVALVSAALLVVAFVLYRAGVGATSMSGSKSTFIFVGSGVKPPDDTKATPVALELAPPPHEAKPGE